jgi:hypothetical protein
VHENRPQAGRRAGNLGEYKPPYGLVGVGPVCNLGPKNSNFGPCHMDLPGAGKWTRTRVEGGGVLGKWRHGMAGRCVWVMGG